MPDPGNVFEDVEVFRAGKYGAKGDFTEADLDKIVQRYEPSSHEAPVTVDHAESGPAAGWVTSVKRVGASIFASLNLHKDFGKLVREGTFKKRSVELYRSPLGLKAVTFLGAMSPAVKGMRDIAFSEGRESVTFDDDATIDSDIISTKFTLKQNHFAILPDNTDPKTWKAPLYDSDTGLLSETLIGQAISYFSPGGFGVDTLKITQGDAGYYKAKSRVVDACKQIGKDPAWANWKEGDNLFAPWITAENLRKYRPDIFAGAGPETNMEEIKMSEKLKEENQALEANLDKAKDEFKNAEEKITELSEKLATLEKEKAKTERTQKLDDAIAEANLSETAATEIHEQFNEAENLDQLQERIDGLKKVMLSCSEGNPITDNGAGETSANGQGALESAANEIVAASDGKVSLAQAVIEVSKKTQ